MLQNKVTLRHRILDQCLRDRMHDYTINDLLDKINSYFFQMEMHSSIGERQLYDDINFLRSPDGYNADIETYRIVRPDSKGRNRSYTAYRYTDPKFSISHVSIREDELKSILNALETINQCTNIPISSGLQKAVEKLSLSFFHNEIRKSIQFAINPFLGGPRAQEVSKYFSTLFKAIQSRYPLIVNYRPFDGQNQLLAFHPFFLRQSRMMWFVLGVTTQQPDKVVTLAIDRIYDLDTCQDPYINFPFDPDEYFEDLVGVLDPGTEPVDVHFQVFGWGAKYIEVSPIHGSQRSSWIEVDGQKALDVHLLVKLNNELEEALLSIMDCIKVLAPQELVESHHQRALQIMRINGLKP